MIRSQIIGVGSYLPPNIVTNHDLEKKMETSDEWIIQRSGIRERRWVSENECTSDLALLAAEEAIENAGIDKKEIDMIVFATITPDHDTPGTGCFLQKKLDLPGIPTFDLRQQCTGFIYGISLADMFIRQSTYKKVLVVCSEVQSKGLQVTTEGRDVSVLFGDGAGACILSAYDVKDSARESYIYSHHLHADGSFAKELWIPAPGTACGHKERINQALIKEGAHYPIMNGKKVYVNAIKNMSAVVLEGLKANDMSLDDVDLFLFHQANMRINEAVAKKLQIPDDKVFNTIEKFGNTTAATIPIGMSEALKAGKLKKGMVVACVAFGSGFTWGASIMRF